MRHVFSTMGTVASLQLPDADPSAVEQVEAIFAAADERFSLYRPDSELSRLNTGQATLLAATSELRDAYEVAVEWRVLTGGAFTPTRPDGMLDLNGVVKATAMRDAGRALGAHGLLDWTLAVGGDLLASGLGPDGTPWATGIADPHNRAGLLCAIDLHGSRRAIATSGSAERGDHIWSAGMVSPFVQVTVVADDIVTADVLATAIVAGGHGTLDEVCERWSIDVLTVGVLGELHATPGIRRALSAMAPAGGTFGPSSR